jgi:hypothetical protein
VTIGLKRESIKNAPPFESAAALNRKGESGLYRHYGRTAYWADGLMLESEVSK